MQVQYDATDGESDEPDIRSTPRGVESDDLSVQSTAPEFPFDEPEVESNQRRRQRNEAHFLSDAHGFQLSERG